MEKTRGSHDSEKVFAPIQSAGQIQGASPAKSRSSSKPPSLQHSRSFGDGHGFTCFRDDEPDVDGAAPHGQAEETEFEVQWEGEKDPANPRSMSRLRKWVIVIIVSSSSACV